MKKLNVLRLIAGGCIFGIAAVSIVVDLFGLPIGSSKDLIGAALGASSTAIAIKLMHLV